MKSLSCVWLFSTTWTEAYQAPPSMGFSRQEYRSGVPLPSPMHTIWLYSTLKNHDFRAMDGNWEGMDVRWLFERFKWSFNLLNWWLLKRGLPSANSWIEHLCVVHFSVYLIYQFQIYIKTRGVAKLTMYEDLELTFSHRHPKITTMCRDIILWEKSED